MGSYSTAVGYNEELFGFKDSQYPRGTIVSEIDIDIDIRTKSCQPWDREGWVYRLLRPLT